MTLILKNLIPGCLPEPACPGGARRVGLLLFEKSVISVLIRLIREIRVPFSTPVAPRN